MYSGTSGSPSKSSSTTSSVTVGAVVASSVSALIVRELFGYSFATWRFHLRGEVIRGPQDVGWVRQLSASSLMRSEFGNAPSTIPIAEAQKLFSPVRVKQIVLRDPNGTYAGIVSSADLHSIATKDDLTLATLAQQREEFLLPDASIRDIMAAFERTEADDSPAEIGEYLRSEHKKARDADRTAQNYEDWRSDFITQVAAAWVLSSVFARFLEDNELVDPPKLAGPNDRLRRARDEHEVYFRAHLSYTGIGLPPE